MARNIPKPERNTVTPVGSTKNVDMGPSYSSYWDALQKYHGADLESKDMTQLDPQAVGGAPHPIMYGRGSDVVRMVADYNHVDPAKLGVQSSISQFQAGAPVTAAGNFYDLYAQGATPDQVKDPNMITATNGVQGPMLGAAPSQNFAMGGMVGQDQMPVLGAALGFADGGQIPGQPAQQMPMAQTGQPGVQPAPSAQPLNPQQADMHIQDMLQRNPQVGQQIQQVVQHAMQTGQIDPQMAQMAVQLAQACLQNPALWPQLRQFAISRGLAGPNDLPQQYDQGLVLTILIAAKAANGQMGSGPGVNSNPNYASGGLIVGPGTGTSDSVHTQNTQTGQPVNVSTGEYVIPAHVVEAKGKDFFDSLLRKYAPLHQGGQQTK